MAVQFNNSGDPREISKNNRALIQQRGDQILEQQGDEANNQQGVADQYRARLDDLYSPMAEGNGGYSQDEAKAITRQDDLDSLRTTGDQLNSNFLTPDEAAGVRGDTASYGRSFDPDQMSQDQAVSAGQQRQAVDDLQQNLKTSIDPDRLRQSGKFQQDSENQLQANQGQFGTVLNAVGNNVRGTIDPNAVTASDSFLKDYNMSPEEQQNLVTSAGISAGAKDAAAVGDLERSARAAGASPEGVAAYRARMARQQSADAGDAMTKARVDASNAAAQRKMSGEQLREQGGQYLTNVRSGTELQMGEDALKGTTQLGQQALDQRNQVEQQRLNAEQSLAGNQITTAAIGGQADIGNEANINAQGRQQSQFNTTTGTGIAEAQDQANSQRAGAIANNRQTVSQANQGTAFNQGMTTNNAASSRAGQVANTRLGAQQNGLNYYQGQNTQANQNSQNAQGREVSTYGTQAGAGNQATSNAVVASQTPSTFDKIVGGATGALPALPGLIKALADGGVATSPTPAIVGEDGPEWVGKVKKGLGAASGIMSGINSGMSGKQPWWKSAGDAAGKAGIAYQQHKQKQADPATSSIDPQKRYPDAYGPAAAPGSNYNFPKPDAPVDGQVIDKPTSVMLDEGDAVVPLGYRAQAKTRPSMAFGQQPMGRRMYGEAA